MTVIRPQGTGLNQGHTITTTPQHSTPDPGAQAGSDHNDRSGGGSTSSGRGTGADEAAAARAAASAGGAPSRNADFPGIELDGDRYVRLPKLESSCFEDGFAIHIKLVPTSLRRGERILELSAGGDKGLIALTHTSGGVVELLWKARDGKLHKLTSPPVLEKGYVSRITVAVGPLWAVFFHNGKRSVVLEPDPKGLGSLPVSNTTRHENLIGRSGGSTPRPFYGKVGDVRLWRCPPLEDVPELARPDLSGKAQGLLGWWPLDNPSRADDGSAFKRNGSIVLTKAPAPAGKDPGSPPPPATPSGGDKAPAPLPSPLPSSSGQENPAPSLNAPAPSQPTDPMAELLRTSPELKDALNKRDARRKAAKQRAKAIQKAQQKAKAARSSKALVVAAGQEITLPSIQASRTGGLSVQLWLDSDADSKTGRILLLSSSRKPGGFMLERCSERGLRARYVATDGKVQLLQVEDALPEGGWAQVTVTVDAQGVACMYVDGELAARQEMKPFAPVDLDQNALGREAASSAPPTLSSILPAQAKYLADKISWDDLTEPTMRLTIERALSTILGSSAPKTIEKIKRGYEEVRRSYRWSGLVTELRVWGRALTAAEVEQGYLYRKTGSVELLLRQPLDGSDLSGKLTWSKLMVIPLMAAPPAPSATVRSKVTLLSRRQIEQDRSPVTVSPEVMADLSDQLKSRFLAAPSELTNQTFVGGLLRMPRLAVELSSVDEKGQPPPAQGLRVVSDRDGYLIFRVDHKKTLIKVEAKTPFTIATDARGVARVEIPAGDLVAPVLKVQHAGMNADDWALVAPDTIMHRTLASLTEGELKKGRRSTDFGSSQQSALVTKGASDMLGVLRSTMGAAAAFSFEDGGDGALALGSKEDAGPKRRRLRAKDGERRRGTFTLPGSRTPTRRIGRSLRGRAFGGAAPLLVDESSAQSFGILDWFDEEIIDPITDIVEDVVEEVEETWEDIEGAVVNSTKLLVNAVIDGVKVAGDWVMETIEDAAEALAGVLKTIGKAVGDVIDWIATLFEWGDILETAEVMLASLKGGLRDVRSMSSGMFERLKGGVDALETKILEVLGGVTISSGASGLALEQPDVPFEMPQLDHLLELLAENLLDVELDLGPFEAIMDTLEGASSKLLGSVFEGIPEELLASGIVDSLKDPSRFADGDLKDVLGVVRIAVKLAFNVLRACVELGTDLYLSILDAVLAVLDIRVNVPFLTDFVESFVLGGKDMTIGRLLSVVAAIPLTVMYKVITGAEHGPFSSDSARSFANPAADITFRVAGTLVIAVGGVLDTVGAITDKEHKAVPVIAALNTAMDAILSVVFGMPLLEHEVMMEKEPLEWDAPAILSMITWAISVLGVGVSGVELFFTIKKNDGALKTLGIIGGAVGAVGGLASTTAGIVELSTQWGEKTEVERRVLFADLFRDLFEAIASGLTIIETKESISKAVHVGSVIAAHGLGFGFSTWGLAETIVDAC
jgi:hypothetical protein